MLSEMRMYSRSIRSELMAYSLHYRYHLPQYLPRDHHHYLYRRLHCLHRHSPHNHFPCYHEYIHSTPYEISYRRSPVGYYGQNRH
jgi:hypothetical protein